MTKFRRGNFGYRMQGILVERFYYAGLNLTIFYANLGRVIFAAILSHIIFNIKKNS